MEGRVITTRTRAHANVHPAGPADSVTVSYSRNTTRERKYRGNVPMGVFTKKVE